MVYFNENPIYKWMMTGGTPMTQETPNIGVSVRKTTLLQALHIYSQADDVMKKWKAHGSARNLAGFHEISRP